MKVNKIPFEFTNLEMSTAHSRVDLRRLTQTLLFFFAGARPQIRGSLTGNAVFNLATSLPSAVDSATFRTPLCRFFCDTPTKLRVTARLPSPSARSFRRCRTLRRHMK